LQFEPALLSVKRGKFGRTKRDGGKYWKGYES
jgi:hypothetical protein